MANKKDPEQKRQALLNELVKSIMFKFRTNGYLAKKVITTESMTGLQWNVDIKIKAIEMTDKEIKSFKNGQ
jgi:hypothetical protein